MIEHENEWVCVYNHDEIGWPMEFYETKEAAIKAGTEALASCDAEAIESVFGTVRSEFEDASFFVGRIVVPEPPIDGETIIERMADEYFEAVDKEFGFDCSVEDIEDLNSRLRKTMKDWLIEMGAYNSTWYVDDMSYIVNGHEVNEGG